MQIKYYNNQSGVIETELVYGAAGVEFLYLNFFGRIIAYFFEFKLFSKLYGFTQSMKLSKKKVLPFIFKFEIKMEQFIKELPQDEVGYSSFNKFFVRKFKPGMRNFPDDKATFGAFCEARYFAHNKLSLDVKYPVKGNFLNPIDLLGGHKWADTFNDGSFIIARLCPVDYHRFHFPDDGEVLDHYQIHDKLISVNPIALKVKPDTFIRNERHVTILETENFGKLAYIEVGAICVGKIIQSFSPKVGSKFKRGQEKGYFLFGGSTVIVLGEKGKLCLDSSLVSRTEQGVETFFEMGKSLY